MITRLIMTLSLVSVCLVLCACVQSKSDLEKYVQDVKKTAKGKIEPLPTAKPIKSVTYSAQTMRSPFVLSGGAYDNTPTVITGANGAVIKQQPRPDASRPREFLEQSPLSSYVMVGTLSKANVNWGLIKDAQGMIHAVKVGDYLGVNSGVIVAITPEQIRVNETVPNGTGGWMQARAVMNLQESQAPATDVTTPAPTTGTKTGPNTGSAPPKKVTPAAPAVQQTNTNSQPFTQPQPQQQQRT